MSGNSRFISSAQEGQHRDLESLVRRHLTHPFRKPILEYNRAAFTGAMGARDRWQTGAPLILDAGCGVGWSTQCIAEACPESFVLGVDQSADRLGRGAVADPLLARRVRGEALGGWAAIVPGVATYWRGVRRKVVPEHAGGRLKQWLALLRLTYPEAGELYQRLRPIKAAHDIDAALVAAGILDELPLAA